ncbi:lymphocyte antigen 6L [Eptesicus fuscus]|uniref:lymphocyte antigen 6L n=1 Tax=Eptesicus fuscus TaxID=29078 RepID=UPI0024043EC9|nr:lymphocyte antigen 6L [Eptesicus fuscus]
MDLGTRCSRALRPAWRRGRWRCGPCWPSWRRTVRTAEPGQAPAKELCRPAGCARADRVCVGHTVTFYSKSKVGVMLSKRCAPRCPNSNMAYEWLSEPWLFRRVQRQCCNVSFCNAAPPAPGRPGARPGALLLPLGLSLLAASP